MKANSQHSRIWLPITLLLLMLLLAACGGPTASPASPTDAPATSTSLAENPTASPEPTVVPTETPTAKPTEDDSPTSPPTHTPTATPTTTPVVSPTPFPPKVVAEQGRAIFQANGCASCHGANGEGIEGLGPALPGHSREAVFQQVREPRQVPEGSIQMPAYSIEQISDEELEQIVAWIKSLGPPMGAGPFAGSMTEAAHMQLALISLQAGSVDDAVVHLQDLVETSEGDVLAQAQVILDLLRADDLDEAEHELRAMLAEAEGSDLSEIQLHIILTLDALQALRDEDAIQHLKNAVGTATGEEKTTLEGLLKELEAGNAHDVHHELERLLGGEPHGS